jgi:hopene-associated glycosyltransferase HpnB
VPVLTALAVLAVAAWIYLLAWHGGYWRTDQRLPRRAGPSSAGPSPGGPGGGHPERWPPVAAVVPARDEAAILPLTLPTLLAQDYPGPFEAVLVDDSSTDGTAEVAAALASRAGAAAALRVVRGRPGPAGWAGKVWAMEQGVRAAGDSEYLLFTDADIAYEQGMLTALVEAAVAGGLDLVSQLALLRARTAWERVLVPAFVYFFAQLYPFRRVNRPGGRTAAAAGGCMLVRRQVLVDAGGMRQICGALIDDVALGRLLKRSPAGGRCWLGFGTGVVSRRPYPGLAELWRMVARSAYYQLRYSPILLACTIAGLLWLYLIPPVATLAGVIGASAGGGSPARWCAAAGLAGWLIMAVTYLPVLRLYRLSPLRAAGLPLIALMYAAMTLDSARRHRVGRGGEWKGRTASRAAGHAADGRRAQIAKVGGSQTAQADRRSPHQDAVQDDP